MRPGPFLCIKLLSISSSCVDLVEHDVIALAGRSTANKSVSGWVVSKVSLVHQLLVER